jgi:hypothetical protein
LSPSQHEPTSSILRIALVAILLVLAGVWLPAAQTRASTPVGIRGEHFVDTNGQSVFLLGANYEGPPDRAWQMWDEGRFDPGLIARDFERARSADISVLRIFVQRSLADDIQSNRWAKLDEVLRLADRYGLRLILTFADYPERRLANLTAIDTAVAARYRGRSTILAYDLKNEPRFGDLALTEYPSGTYAALQDASLIPLIGETIARQDISEYRASEEGETRIPAGLDDHQAYVYANTLAGYVEFLSYAQDWARSNDSTTVAYTLAPDSGPWDQLEDAMNDTLATWMKLRLDTIRAADPAATVTVGHIDPILASLPGNNLLDYRTLHRYPAASSAGIESAIALFRDVRRSVPGKALVLGEFGFANAEVSEDRSAQLEAELVRAVRENGGAGALKWMLNDFPQGFSPRENTLGMFRGDGTPKPIVGSFRELAVLTPASQPGPPRSEDYSIAEGHFFTQTSGRPSERDPSGYSVTDAEGIRFWDAWQRLGLENLGYPLSARFTWRGLSTQVFQKAVLQSGPDGVVSPVNLFDELHDRGLDGQLRVSELVPFPIDPSTETAGTWDELVRTRLAVLEDSPEIGDRYAAVPDPVLLYGLPTSRVEDVGSALALRTQRAVLLQWKIDVPWAAAGEVTVANGGEIATRLGVFPVGALVPEPAPPADELR